jgi:acetylornithine deacetylase/succinyl-diaminopimelate desuccinylase-like protein
VEGRVRIAEELRPYFQGLNDPVEQGLWLKFTAERLGVEEVALRQSLASMAPVAARRLDPAGHLARKLEISLHKWVLHQPHTQAREELEEWAGEWREKAAYGNKKGFVNLGGIRGGDPWRASRTPDRTDLFLDVRVPPTMSMQRAGRELKKLFLDLRKKHPDYGLEFETYVSVPGAEISEKHELVKAIEKSHRGVTGKRPARDTVLWSSDASVLSRYGIDTVNYGPSSGPHRAPRQYCGASGDSLVCLSQRQGAGTAP